MKAAGAVTAPMLRTLQKPGTWLTSDTLTWGTAERPPRPWVKPCRDAPV